MARTTTTKKTVSKPTVSAKEVEEFLKDKKQCSNCGKILDMTRGQLGNTNYSTANRPVLVRDFVTKQIKIVAIAAGADHSLALSEDGYVYTFGRNNRGQLGYNNGLRDYNATPTAVAGVSGNGLIGGVIDMVAGAAHSMILLGKGPY